MTYATLLVHLLPGQSNATLLDVAAQLADRFEARVVGIAACQPLMVVSGDGYVCGDVFSEDQRRITIDLDAAQAEFRDALRGRSPGIEWRSTIALGALADYVCMQARSADLVLTGRRPADAFDLSRTADVGALAMQAGRPLLVVPPEAAPLRFDQALVGWKDTRESRRAAGDALPLLEHTRKVTVLEIAALDDLDAAGTRVADVVTWLERHGVMADGRVERSAGDDAAQLLKAAREARADLVVAGAYGHSRLREWALGGVTRELLLSTDRCVLVSH